MTACINENTNIVKMLINNGADINRQDSYGATPLIEASFRGHPEIVSLLLENGVDVTVVDRDGYTALMIAIEYENTEIVTLIKNHINRLISLVIKKGRTKKRDKPLVPYAHRETIYYIASFF